MNSSQLLSSLAHLLGPGAQVAFSTLQRAQNLLYFHHATDIVIGAYAIFYLLPRLKSWVVHLKCLFATVYGEESQDFYFTLLDWTSARLATSRTVKLVATHDHEPTSTEKTAPEHFHTAYLRRSMKYQPWYGTTWFWHNGSLFIVERLRDRSTSYARQGDEETIVFRTLGLSTQPIKDLFSAIVASDESGKHRTNIFSTRPKHARAFAGPWSEVSSQPVRPMQSVALDEQTKQDVVCEIGEFLQPCHARFCAERGIPWRRGYLFHGSPGTGKTSFATALAGRFGLPVYVVPLQDSDVDDADLLRMFSCLPRRCLVLLEDLDTICTAGSRTKSDDISRTQTEDRAGKISLSGLLNAIDGIASSEGRILLVTTNFLERLDEALLRPGRIDRKIHFPLLSKALAQQMFVRMYQDEEGDMGSMAKQFGDLIPDGTLSPAVVQEFLFARDPRKAIARARAFKEAGEEGGASRTGNMEAT